MFLTCNTTNSFSKPKRNSQNAKDQECFKLRHQTKV